MTQLPIVLLEIAEDDIAQAMGDFEEKRPGFGYAFLLEVHETLAYIHCYPTMYQIIESPLRRAVLQRFQFAIAYRIMADCIEVVGVMPTRAFPDKLATRIKQPRHDA